MISSIQKILSSLVAIILIWFLGYNMFIKDSDIKVNLDGSSTTDLVGQDILVLVEKLKTISIDQNVFSGPMFSNLRDFTQVVSPEPQGKVNPFALIGSDIFISSSNFTQSSSTQSR